MKYGFCKEFSTPMKTEVDYELIKMIKEAPIIFLPVGNIRTNYIKQVQKFILTKNKAIWEIPNGLLI